jgi:hypothetical protein
MEQIKQQTAVDSLWDSLACLFFFQDGIPVEAMERYNQAKQIEEERMMNFANWCRIHDSSNPNQVWTIQQLFEKYNKEIK